MYFAVIHLPLTHLFRLWYSPQLGSLLFRKSRFSLCTKEIIHDRWPRIFFLAQHISLQVFNLTTSLLQFVTIAEHCLFALYPYFSIFFRLITSDFGYKVHNVISSTSIANFMSITYFPYTELHIQKPLSSDPYGSSYLVYLLCFS